MNQNTGEKTIRRETGQWHEAYRSDALTQRRWATHFKKLKRAGILAAAQDDRILDICCGEGEMLEMLAARGMKSLIGADLVSEYPGRPTIAPRRWQYVASSADKLPFKPGTFDWVLCAHSLHHLGGLANIKALVEDAYTCLKPGGRLVLIDHYDSPQLRLALAVLCSPLAVVTPYTRAFRQQHLEEKEFMYDYLDHWPQLFDALEHSKFSSFTLKKGLLFFYFTARK